MKTSETIENYVIRKGFTHMGVAEAMNMQRNTWYKNRVLHCKNVSIEEIHRMALHLRITPCKAFEMTYNMYLSTVSNEVKETVPYLKEC